MRSRAQSGQLTLPQRTCKPERGRQGKGEWNIEICCSPQNSVGYAWVRVSQRRTGQSPTRRMRWMESGSSCRQFSNKMYVIDHHHHLAALDYASHDSVEVTVYIVCNLSEAEASSTSYSRRSNRRKWHICMGVPRMSQTNFLRPSPSSSSFPASIAFNKTFTTMADDRWRSLAGFTRQNKIDDCSKDKNTTRAA